MGAREEEEEEEEEEDSRVSRPSPFHRPYYIVSE